jgi:hypothetical protein
MKILKENDVVIFRDRNPKLGLLGVIEKIHSEDEVFVRILVPPSIGPFPQWRITPLSNLRKRPFYEKNQPDSPGPDEPALL